MSQTEILIDQVEALEGMPSDSGFTDKISRHVSDAKVDFGRGVATTANVNESAIPAATAFVFDGVAIRTATKELKKGETDTYYEVDDAMSVMRKGRIWVRPEVAITLGDDVYLRHTVGSGTDIPGKFRSDADTAKADQLTNARWLTETSGVDEVCLLEIFQPS